MKNLIIQLFVSLLFLGCQHNQFKLELPDASCSSPNPDPYYGWKNHNIVVHISQFHKDSLHLFTDSSEKIKVHITSQYYHQIFEMATQYAHEFQKKIIMLGLHRNTSLEKFNHVRDQIRKSTINWVYFRTKKGVYKYKFYPYNPNKNEPLLDSSIVYSPLVIDNDSSFHGLSPIISYTTINGTYSYNYYTKDTILDVKQYVAKNKSYINMRVLDSTCTYQQYIASLNEVTCETYRLRERLKVKFPHLEARDIRKKYTLRNRELKFLQQYIPSFTLDNPPLKNLHKKEDTKLPINCINYKIDSSKFLVESCQERVKINFEKGSNLSTQLYKLNLCLRLIESKQDLTQLKSIELRNRPEELMQDIAMVDTIQKHLTEVKSNDLPYPNSMGIISKYAFNSNKLQKLLKCFDNYRITPSSFYISKCCVKKKAALNTPYTLGCGEFYIQFKRDSLQVD